LLTIKLLQNIRIHAICYGPPLLLNPSLANHADTQAMITSVVHNNDMIARASLTNAFKLRDQMTSLFSAAAPSKWKLLRSSLKNDTQSMFISDEAYLRAVGRSSNPFKISTNACLSEVKVEVKEDPPDPDNSLASVQFSESKEPNSERSRTNSSIGWQAH